MAAAGAAGTTAAALVLGADIVPAQGIYFSFVFFTIFMTNKREKNVQNKTLVKQYYLIIHNINPIL